MKLKSTPSAARAQHIARRRGCVGGAQGAAAGHGPTFAIPPFISPKARAWAAGGETIGAPSAARGRPVVHTDQLVVAHGLARAAGDRAAEAVPVFPVAGKTDDATREWVRQAAAVISTLRGGASDVEDRGACSVMEGFKDKLLQNLG